jgi:hypothetical protein
MEPPAKRARADLVSLSRPELVFMTEDFASNWRRLRSDLYSSRDYLDEFTQKDTALLPLATSAFIDASVLKDVVITVNQEDHSRKLLSRRTR